MEQLSYYVELVEWYGYNPRQKIESLIVKALNYAGNYQYSIFFVKENVLIIVKNKIVWHGIYLFFQSCNKSQLKQLLHKQCFTQSSADQLYNQWIAYIKEKQYENLFKLNPSKFVEIQKFENINSDEADQLFKPGDIIAVDRGTYSHYGIWINYSNEDKIFHVTGDGTLLNYFFGSNSIDSTSEGIYKSKTSFDKFVNGGTKIKRVRYILSNKSENELWYDIEKFKKTENYKYSLIKNNCEHVAYNISTNYKYSTQAENASIFSIFLIFGIPRLFISSK